jgi:hypothetical protein
MSLAELLPVVDALTREEKMQLVQLVSQQLAVDPLDLIEPGQSYPVWLADREFDAAEVLQKLLDDEKARS